MIRIVSFKVVESYVIVIRVVTFPEKLNSGKVPLLSNSLGARV